MRRFARNWSTSRLLPLAFLVLAELTTAADARAQTRQKDVLTLYSARRDAQISIVGDRELPRVLARGLPEGLDYYSEFIDLPRYQEGDYQTAFEEFLRLKYEGHKFDVLIVMDNIALEFVETIRTRLFPGTPVIFFSSRPAQRRIPNSTGIAVELNLTGTLTLATELQPDVRNIFVVTGADRTYETMARTQFRPFESRYAFTYLAALATTDLEARLTSLPAHSIVLYVHVNRDGAGENFNPIDYVERIAAVANAPTYTWVDSAMNRGVVGGNLRRLSAQAEAVGALALRVLRGEAADDIPVAAPDLSSRQVDWRQLRRWRIAESRVPSGTLVMFRELSAWDRYKVYILVAIGLLLGQTGLIIGLLVQSTRRRLAEERVRFSELALRSSHERIHDLGARLLNAQDSERARIARELHDDISQQIALLEMDLELAGLDLSGREVGPVDEAVSRVRGIARSVHDLSHRLHPAKLSLMGLLPALDGLGRELSQSAIAVTVTHDNMPPTLPPNVTLCLFRVTQEALNNALKYSQGRRASVHLQGTSAELTLTISDDGAGFDADQARTKGLGLVSMRERVEAIGGAFELRSEPGAGTRVVVRIPRRIVEMAEDRERG